MCVARAVIIIGCGPGLYRESRVISSMRRGYDGNRYSRSDNTAPYIKQRPSASGHTGRSAQDPDTDINLSDYPRAVTQILNESSSQEELVNNEPVCKGGRVTVTRSVMVSNKGTVA